MSFPVRWFFWLPFAVFLLFTMALGSAAGNALGGGDIARFLVLALTASLGGFGSAACCIVASGKQI